MKICVVFVAVKQWQMQYYASLVETGILGRCGKNDMVTSRFAIHFKCSKRKGCHENHNEKLHRLKTMKDFFNLGGRISTGGVCEASVAYRTRLEFLSSRECQDLLLFLKFIVIIKGVVSKSCMRSAMLYGN